MKNAFVRMGIAAAAVVALVLVGLRFLPAGDDAGEQPSQSVGGPSPTAIPSPASSPIPLQGGPLRPGTYFIGPDLKDHWMACPEPPTPGCSNTMLLTFTIPPYASATVVDPQDGWAGVAGSIWLYPEQNRPPAGAGMIFTRGGWLRSDPCTPAQDASGETPVDIPVGPTADDFATALADHPLLDTTTPIDVTLAGYSGKYMDLQVPDISRCTSRYEPWDGNIYAQGSGHRWHLWILDVDGQRVVVEATDFAGTSAQDRAELQSIVDSVAIEP